MTLPSLAVTIFLSKFLTEMYTITVALPGETTVSVFDACERAGQLKVDLHDGAGFIPADEALPPGSEILKKKFVSTDIARVPPGGYRKYYHGHSANALKWMEICAVDDQRKIYHAGNWSEVGIFV